MGELRERLVGGLVGGMTRSLVREIRENTKRLDETLTRMRSHPTAFQMYAASVAA